MEAHGRVLLLVCTIYLLRIACFHSIVCASSALDVSCNSPCLLVATSTEIVALDYNNATIYPIIWNLTDALAIDFHFNLGYIFWSDLLERNIKRANIDGTNITVLHNITGYCRGLAVEWRSSQLYWTNTYGTISVSDLEGNNKRILLPSQSPRGIVLDPERGLMFWMDSYLFYWEIKKSTLNGTQLVTLVTHIRSTAGIDLDRRKKLVFWVYGGSNSIGSVDYDGNNRKLFYQFKVYAVLSGLAFLSSNCFVCDLRSHGVFKLNDSNGTSTAFVSFNGFSTLKKLVPYDRSRQLPVMTCPALHAPSNGTRLGCQGNATMYYDTVCQFSCNKGYIGSGSQVRRCQHNGTWSGQDFTCQIINCTSLTADPGGPLRMYNCSHHYGSKCNFSCIIGHRLNGSSTVTCNAPGNQHPGVWDNVTPTCEVVTCPALPSPSNSVQHGCSGNATEYPYDTVCRFSCVDGYKSSGSSVRRCQENGLWDGEEFSCERIFCEPLQIVPNIKMNASCTRLPGDACEYACERGYDLIGSDSRWCNSNGSWTGTQPRCEAVMCPTLSPPTNGELLGCNTTEMLYDTECRFSCKKGSEASGSTVRRCTENGTWSGNDLVCTGITKGLSVELSYVPGHVVTLTTVLW